MCAEKSLAAQEKIGLCVEKSIAAQEEKIKECGLTNRFDIL